MDKILKDIRKGKEALNERYHRFLGPAQGAVPAESDFLKRTNEQEGDFITTKPFFAVFCALKYTVCLHI